MLSLKNKDATALDVKSVSHNSQNHKLVLLKDGDVYKIKMSKLEDNEKPGLRLTKIFLKYVYVCWLLHSFLLQ